MKIKELVDQILMDGQITPDELDRLKNAIMADGQIDDEEISEIHRVMDMIRKNKVKVLDEKDAEEDEGSSGELVD